MMSSTVPASPNDDVSPLIGSLIRARRRQLSMTLKDLGAAARLSVSFLSQVERDQATPSLGALAGIARGLGVDMEYFIATPAIENGLTRAGDRHAFSLKGSSVLYERLSTDFPGQALSAFLIGIPPRHRSETVSHAGEEIVYLIEGRLSVVVDGVATALGPGDSLHFRASSAHSWTNETDQTARLLWVGTVPLFRSIKEQPAIAYPA